ncbi:MAG: Nif3-like dinuclear metal center hexameric protein [Kiritimatiellaceae bacterium]|nr:MAG: Nif3-like dinuclear metal center hexameric protein [Kiritimatiellaceae bacterium]|tara:strand:+ start:232 stop:1011 length:780 start_codon:yes stop_codon:yes gene_type:complete
MKLSDVIRSLDKIAPLEGAAEWDHVGLLLEPSENPTVKRALLTIDLTEAVLKEAIEKKVSLIITYHPILFHPVQTLRATHPAEKLLLTLIQKKIAVYSPHTALDAVKGGVNDWLTQGLGAARTLPIQTGNDQEASSVRRVELHREVSLATLSKRMKAHLNAPYLRVADGGKKTIKTVACCAGAGSSVLEGIDADCYLTGEMSHHAVLAANAAGRSIILSEHTHTERGYLPLYQDQIQQALNHRLIPEISEQDRDPLQLK